jgi:chromosome partitioning protein
MQTDVLLNQKGGVGKTTNTLHLAGVVAESGQRVLMVDLDGQGNLTSAFRAPRLKEPATLAAAMLGDFTGDPRELVHPLGDRLHLIPSALDMFTLPRQLYTKRASHERLRRVLERLERDYDRCFIDCRPALDIDTDNALEYANGVLIPVDVDEFSIEALRLLLAQVSTLTEELRRPPVIYRGLIINRVARPFSAFHEKVYQALHSLPLPVVGEIPLRTALAEAKNKGQTIVEYAPRSDVAAMFRDAAKNASYLDGAR